MIVNAGVGDVEAIVSDSGGGVVMYGFTAEHYRETVDAIAGLMQKEPQSIRANITKVYSLEEGVKQYSDAYKVILG